MTTSERRDHVAEILEAWRIEHPNLDTSPIGIFGRITRIERHKNQALRAVYRAHGIDGGEYNVLAALRRAGPAYQMTPTALYRSVLVGSATMTERLDRLERRKHIQRHHATGDRRSILVELTSRGRTLIDQAVIDLVAAEAALLDRLTTDEQATLSTLLATLAVQLEHPDQTPPRKPTPITD